ncbi:MAG: hypothetical protein M3Y32_07610 [Pseudomonadota bacterium]|nr:hypothetical protein [Pseudomonadota bacterium]
MKLRRTGHSIGWLLLAASGTGFAADGLQAPSADAVWPRFQSRISLPSAGAAWLQAGSLLGSANAHATSASGSVLGDYYFATHGLSHFRASGGLLLGAASGGSLAAPVAGSGLALRSPFTTNEAAAGSDLAVAAPYLGLGYSGQLWRSGISLSADVGMVAERAVISGSGASALFGNQALDGAVRELRLSPLFQVGVRYSF